MSNTITTPTPQSTRHASGSFDPVVYFENYRGSIAIPPSTADALRIKDHMEKRGFLLREACNIQQVEDLQRRLQKQDSDAREGRLEREEHLFKRDNEARRQRLLSRRNSSSCTPFERDAIDEHLRNQELKHAAKLKAERAVTSYFEALEFNENSHHLMDATHNVPDMAAEQCTRCRKYRKIQGLTICAVCSYEVTQEHGRV